MKTKITGMSERGCTYYVTIQHHRCKPLGKRDHRCELEVLSESVLDLISQAEEIGQQPAEIIRLQEALAAFLWPESAPGT